jgi:hypothetical protein
VLFTVFKSSNFSTIIVGLSIQLLRSIVEPLSASPSSSPSSSSSLPRSKSVNSVVRPGVSGPQEVPSSAHEVSKNLYGSLPHSARARALVRNARNNSTSAANKGVTTPVDCSGTKNAPSSSTSAASKGDVTPGVTTPVDCSGTKNAPSSSTSAASKGDVTPGVTKPVDCNDNLLATQRCNDTGGSLTDVDKSTASKTALQVDDMCSSQKKIGCKVEPVDGTVQTSNSGIGDVTRVTGKRELFN